MLRDWKTRRDDAGPTYTIRRGDALSRTEMAAAFRRLVQTVITPGFQTVAESAAGQGVRCTVDCELGGIHPRATFLIRPSGRSIRFQLDADGGAVREIEGVYHRPLGQRTCWTTVEEMQRQLTGWYVQSAAAAIVQDHFRSLDARGA